MAIASVRLIPGQNSEVTPAYEAAAYDLVEYGRFKAGLFQKLGGWSKYYPFAVSGVARALHAWQDLDAVKRLAVATTTTLSAITNGTLQDISPQELITDDAPDFSTTSGSSTVEIVDTNINNVTTDDSVELLTPVSVGGLILSGIYRIASRTGTTSYTIEAAADATATVANGGAVPIFDTTLDSSTIEVTLPDHAQVAGTTAVFPLPTAVGGLIVQGKYTVISVISPDIFTVNATSSASSTDTAAMNSGDAGFRYYIAVGPGGAGLGYGLGFYGFGPYGLGGGSGANQTGTAIAAENYVLDNWGELLIATINGGGIYFWGPKSGFQNMSLIAEAPLFNQGAFVSQALQQIISYGGSVDARDPVNNGSTGVAGIGIYRDPLLIQYCDLSNFFEWQARADTQAGNYRIPNGSLIVGGVATKNRNLFWTDLGLWAFTYIGQPLIYSPNQVGDGCGLIGQHAFTRFGDAVYWMSTNNFFMYAGSGVQVVPCSVWDTVFQDLNPDYQHLSVAGTNSDFTEIWFFWCSTSGGKTYPDKYAKYNTIEQTWESGPVGRLAWIDRSILGAPIGVDGSGLIFSHETGFDADNAAMTPRFRTGFFTLSESQEFVFIDQITPDFRWGTVSGDQDAQISVTLYVADEPGETPRQNGPYLFTINSRTKALDPPVRAKYVAAEVRSADAGSFWRLGLVRFRYSASGRHGGYSA